MYKIIRILLILSSVVPIFIFSQNAEELKRFMDTYDKLKVDQQANEIVKKIQLVIYNPNISRNRIINVLINTIKYSFFLQGN